MAPSSGSKFVGVWVMNRGFPLWLVVIGALVMANVGCVTPQQEVTTHWQKLGIPQAFNSVRDNLKNRRGNRPQRERKPKLLKLADPKLKELEGKNVEAIKVAQEIKAEEDLAAQKIKAIKYLGLIGCSCYDDEKKIQGALLKALSDCTPCVRLAAISAIHTSIDQSDRHAQAFKRDRERLRGAIAPVVRDAVAKLAASAADYAKGVVVRRVPNRFALIVMDMDASTVRTPRADSVAESVVDFVPLLGAEARSASPRLAICAVIPPPDAVLAVLAATAVPRTFRKDSVRWPMKRTITVAGMNPSQKSALPPPRCSSDVLPLLNLQSSRSKSQSVPSRARHLKAQKTARPAARKRKRKIRTTPIRIMRHNQPKIPRPMVSGTIRRQRQWRIHWGLDEIQPTGRATKTALQ